MPFDSKLPKLRNRGFTIKESLVWYEKQKIDPKLYKADFVPHSDTQVWSTIFIVNKFGIFGEIIKGGHYQLTQGVHDSEGPISFEYDFKNWSLSEDNPVALEYLK